MKRKILAWICGICLLFTVCLTTAFGATIPEDRLLPRLVDDADLLTDGEEADLLAKLDEISERLVFDVAVVTVDSLEGATPAEFADDYFDYNGFGMGADDDGVVLLISMEERDWYISTHAYGITAFTDAGIDYIGEAMLYDLGDGFYADAFTTFADLCDDFVQQARTGNPYDVDNMPKEPFAFFFWLVVAFVIAFIIALISVSVMKGKLKSVRPQRGAADYMVRDSFRLTNSGDYFLYRNVTKRPRPKDTSSSGGGGSSTHSSSSGRSHGGGGGKF